MMQFHIKEKSMFNRSKWSILFICFIILSLTGSWGFLVHRTVTQLAIYKLPKKMQPFFYTYLDSLVQHSIRPDQRRNADSTEAPKHFIDLEVFGDSAAWKMPMQWQEAVSKFSKDTLEKYGYVPYWIITVKDRLTNAFCACNKDSILFYASEISHYIGDANVPLHTTLNYDGQLTNQRGLHSLWESTIPALELDQYQLYSRHKAQYLSDPNVAIWKAIQNAHVLVDNMLEEERQASKQFTDSTKYRVQVRNGREVRSYSTAFAKAYSQRLKNTVNQQLLSSANLIADFWYTSWVDAGKPDLKFLMTPMNNEKKKQLKSEKDAYLKNKLIEKKLLLARQNTESPGN